MRATAKVRQMQNIFIRVQNGEIEIVKRFREKIAGKESFKGAVLRLMKEASK